MRPIYESGADRRRERKVADFLEDRWAVNLRRNPRMYPVDFCAVKGDRVTGFVEIKCRDVYMDTYPTLILSYHKFMIGTLLEQDSCRFVVVARWKDAVGWVAPSQRSFDRQPYWGGRRDRDDPQDEEPVIHIPIKIFRRL